MHLNTKHKQDKTTWHTSTGIFKTTHTAHIDVAFPEYNTTKVVTV